jgi:hypothetical protein
MQSSVKKRPLIANLSSLVIVGLVIGLSILVYQMSQPKQVAKTRTLSITDKTKPSDSKNFKTLAQQRLSTLTSGIPLQDIISTVPTTINKNTVQTPNIQSTISVANSLKTPQDSQKAIQVQQTAKQPDDVVFYNETEDRIYADPIYTSNEGGTVKSPVQKDKIIITKSWVSANYAKFVSIQGGSINQLNLNTPDFQTSYLGGEYSIKEIYGKKQFFSSILNTTFGKEGELSFLTSLINDTNIQNEGLIIKDGKNLQVFSTKPILQNADPEKITLPTGAPQKARAELQNIQYITKYYVDNDTFTLYLSEFYQDGTLQSSSKTINSKEYKEPTLETYFHTEEIKNKPTREISRIEMQPDENTLTQFNKQYPIYYPEKLYKPQRNLSFYSYNSNQTELYKLYNTVEFDPNISKSEIQDSTNPILATYSTHIDSTNGIYLISVNIYKSQPDNSTQNYGTHSAFSKQLGEYFYQFNQLSEGDNLTPQLTFTPLSGDEVLQIEKNMQVRNLAYPQYETISVSDIPIELRYLPGDLSKDFDGLEIGNISHSPKKTDTDGCYNEIDSVYLVVPCLVEKYRGYSMYFRRIALLSPTPILGQNTKNIDYLDISVLDTPLATIDIDDIKSKIRETPGYIDELNFPLFYSVKGKTVIVSNQDSALKNSIDSIVNRLELSKDEDVLIKQLQKNSTDLSYTTESKPK